MKVTFIFPARLIKTGKGRWPYLRRILRGHGAEILEGVREGRRFFPQNPCRDIGQAPRLRAHEPVRASADEDHCGRRTEFTLCSVSPARSGLLPYERRAACAIICDEATAMKLTKNTKNKPLRIWVTAGSHTLRPADRRDMAIPLLPNETAKQYKDLGKSSPAASAIPGSPVPCGPYGGLLCV